MHLSDITGVELLRKVRTEAPSTGVPFILISSDPDVLDPTGLRCRRTVVLAKPFALDQLAQALLQVAADEAAASPLSSGPGAGK